MVCRISRLSVMLSLIFVSSTSAGLVTIDTDYAAGLLIATDTNADDIADLGMTTHNYSQVFVDGGVSYTLSFDLTANGASLQDDYVECWEELKKRFNGTPEGDWS
ncbi:MAG: hypothetical protein AB8G99_10820 [Planctomycetaceae bacterium]